jgi:NitT/TauT family transport system substrate-binding protein
MRRSRVKTPHQGTWDTASSLRPLGGLQLLSGLGLLAALSAGCKPHPATLTVPVSNWPGYEYFYLAQQQNLAKGQALDLRIQEFADPQAIVHSYLQGEVPIAQLTTVEAVDICSRAPSRCPVVVLVLDESRGGDQLLARPPIKAIPQLRGRTVAVTQSTLGSYVLSRALGRHGLTLADVQLSHMPLDAIPAALADGSVDAAALFPPYSDQARDQAGATRLFDSREIPGEIFDILVVEPQAQKRFGTALPKLLRAWQAAHALRDRQSEVAIAVMAQRERLSPQAFREAEKGLVYFNLPQQQAMLATGGVLERNLRAVQRVQIQLGLVQPSSPLPRVDAGPVRAALR